MNHFIKILFLTPYFFFSFSTPAFPEEPTIETLVETAIQNDPILKQLDKKISAERSKIGEGFSHPPLQISYGYFFLPIQTRNGPQRQKISMKQSFAWPGLASSVGELPAKNAALILPQKALRVRELRFKVEQVAWTLWHHQKQITLTQAHMVLLDGLISSTRSLNLIGRVPKSAVSLATLEKAKIVDRFENEKNNVEVAKKWIQRWTGIKVERVLVQTSIARPIEKTTQLEKHPRLDVLDRADMLDRAKITLEDKKDMPQFSIGVDYFEIGENENASSGQDGLMAMVGVSIPIWSTPSGAAIEALEGSIIARSFLRENIKKEILSDLEIEALKIEDHRRKIRYLEKTIIPLAEVYRADLTAEFETDRAKIQDVIEALNRVYRLQLELADAQAQFEKARSKQIFESGNTAHPDLRSKMNHEENQ